MRELLFKFGNKVGIDCYLHGDKKNHLTVLSLHRISEDRDYFFEPISPEQFTKLLEYVTRKYTIINFELLHKNSTYSKPPLILSFDDGYYDFIEHALPILNRFGVPANHNLVNSCLSGNMTIWTQELNTIFCYLKRNGITDDQIISSKGRPFSDCANSWFNYYQNFFNFLCGIKYSQRKAILDSLKCEYGVRSNYRMMDWSDASKLVRAGIEIGSHSYRHDSLSTLDTEEEMQSEILNSIVEMKKKLEVEISILAPPNGLCNVSIISYAQKIGIKNILLVGDQITSLATLTHDFNVFHRIGMANESESEMILRTELFHSRIRRFREALQKSS